ncbi:MAG: hypothetical protein JXR37_01700 [Kiritimatiellae bacterium]|nr:hypothetical protein [Kiritimatiellia bacterium]
MFLGAGSLSAAAALYHIDPTAAADGDGSPASPWRGWERVEWHDGSTYLQRAGTTWSGPIVDIRAHNVTLGKYGSGLLPVLKLTTKGGNTPVVNINGKTGCTIQDLRFESGTGEKSGTSGVKVGGKVGLLRILRCQFTVLKFGIRLQSVKAEKVLVDGCEMWNFGEGPRGRGGDGIWAVCDNLEVCNCHMHDLDQSAEDGIQGANEVANWHIHHNRIDESASNKKQCIIISGDAKGKPPLIEHNELIGRPCCVMLINCGGIVRYNRMLSANRAVSINATTPDCPDVQVYGNLIRDCGAGVMVESYSGGRPRVVTAKIAVSVTHNTFRNVKTGVCNRQPDVFRSPLVLKNNIFALQPGATAIVMKEKAFVSDYNCFYPEQPGLLQVGGAAFGSVAAFQKETGLDAHSIAADPLFADADGFRLRRDSPCLRRGAKTERIPKDFAGNPFGNPPALGALEFGSSDALTFAPPLSGQGAVRVSGRQLAP